MKSLRHEFEGKNVEGRTFTPYEVELYSKFWGEGSEMLTDLLRYCLENNITTQACCKGHPKRDNLDGYIVFSGNDVYFVKFISYKILTDSIANGSFMYFSSFLLLQKSSNSEIATSAFLK